MPEAQPALRRLALATSLVFAAPLPAQPQLAVDGGSLPGTVAAAFGPHRPFAPALIALSAGTGPIPLAILDPRDPRELWIGIEALGASAFGLTDASGFLTFRVTLPAMPAFLDRAVFLQAMEFDGLAGINNLIGVVSPMRAVRFAPAGAFRRRATQLADPRSFSYAVPLPDGRWMVPGGGSGALLAQIARATSEIYDTRTDALVAGPTMSTPRSVHTVTALADGRTLIAAGVDGNNDPQTSVEVFDPSTMQFQTTASLAAPRMGHTATRLGDGRVLVAGGLSDLNGVGIDPVLSALDSTEIWNPATGAWTAGPAMSRPRAGHAALTLPDGRVLIAGGVGYQTIIFRIPAIWTQAEIYDPNSNRFTAAPSMATPRAIFAAGEVAPGKFLAAGGVSSLLGLGAPTNAAEVYDAASGSWSPVGSMVQARGITGDPFPLGNGRFLLVGGADNTLLSPNALDTTEVYDAGTGTFTAGPRLTLSRAAFIGFATPTGQLHVIGGGTGMNAAGTTLHEWFYR